MGEEATPLLFSGLGSLSVLIEIQPKLNFFGSFPLISSSLSAALLLWSGKIVHFSKDGLELPPHGFPILATVTPSWECLAAVTPFCFLKNEAPKADMREEPFWVFFWK